MKYSRKYANRIKRKMTILALSSVAITCCALAVFKTLSYEDQISKIEKEIFTAKTEIRRAGRTGKRLFCVVAADSGGASGRTAGRTGKS